MNGQDRLAEIRRELDTIDEAVIGLLCRRVDLCREVAGIKRTTGIPMMQHGRVDTVRNHYVAGGAAGGLSPDFSRRLVDLLLGETCRVEAEIIDAAEPA